MSLFTDFRIGTSGLFFSQNAINTTSHNLANVETEGYVRQQIVAKDTTYNTLGYTHSETMQAGIGVSTEIIRQVRDRFLDQTYRMESGRQGYYDSLYEASSEIENLFGELNGVAFQDTLEDIWVALQELSKEPDSRVAQATLVETAVSFIERSEQISEQMLKYQLNLNTQITNDIERINQISDRIVDLNADICFYESNKQDHANDLRDERNALLDELGHMVKMTYEEIPNGKVIVSIEGTKAITEDYCLHMSSLTAAQYYNEQGLDVVLDSMAGALIPTWEHLGAMPVFDMVPVPSTESGTDVGSLKGLLIARGTRVGKYTDLPVEPKEEDYLDANGDFDEDKFKLAMGQYNSDLADYEKNVSPSIIMTVEAQFDKLVNGVVNAINDALCPQKEVWVSAGTTIDTEDGETYTFEEDTKIRILDVEKAPVGVDENSTMGTELFSRINTPRYFDAQDITLADGTTIEGALIFREEGMTYKYDDEGEESSEGKNYTLYTIGEIRVNPDLIQDKSKLPIIANDGTRNYDVDMIEGLLETWQSPFASITPQALTVNNFQSYYNALIGELGTRGDEYNTLATNQENMVASVEEQRQSKHGASSDEELTYLIQYQHSYNAASRYITVVNEMLETLLTRM